MTEFYNPDSFGFVHQRRLRSGYRCMTLSALVGRERFFAVVASPAGLTLVDLRHRDFVLSLGNRKQFGMAVVAFERGRMRSVHELNRRFSRADENGFLRSAHSSGGGFVLHFRVRCFEALHAAMTAGALRIGSKCRFAVMAGAAILALIKRLHGEILLFLYGQSLHFKQFRVTLLAAEFASFHMDLMAERHRLDRLRINNIIDLRSALRKQYPRGAKKKCCCNNR